MSQRLILDSTLALTMLGKSDSRCDKEEPRLSFSLNTRTAAHCVLGLAKSKAQISDCLFPAQLDRDAQLRERLSNGGQLPAAPPGRPPEGVVNLPQHGQSGRRLSDRKNSTRPRASRVGARPRGGDCHIQQKHPAKRSGLQHRR